MAVEWKDIEGYEGKYKISNEGDIYSFYKRGCLKPALNNWGYKYVSLSKNNLSKSYVIHRLVALHFIDNPEKLPTVNHIDGNKVNNDISNLEWASYSENMSHAFRTGLNKPAKGLDRSFKLSPENVREIRRDFLNGQSIRAVAKKYGISYDYAYKFKVGKARKNVI